MSVSLACLMSVSLSLFLSEGEEEAADAATGEKREPIQKLFLVVVAFKFRLPTRTSIQCLLDPS